MIVDISGNSAHLVGNWTRTEMTNSNIDSLALTLRSLETTVDKNLRIDCGQLQDIDASGLQLINFWLRCFSFMGFKLEIVNCPDQLRKNLQNLRVKICSAEKAFVISGADLVATNPFTRSSTLEN